MENPIEEQTKKIPRFTLIVLILSVAQIPVYYLFLLIPFARAALASMAIIAAPVLSIVILVLNILALKKSKKNQSKGKGLAIAGIVTSSLSLLVVLLYDLIIIAFLSTV